MIGSTRHHLVYANSSKRKILDEFVSEYSRVCLFYINEIWKGYDDFDAKDNLDLPKRLDYKRFDIETPLSARARQNCINQAGGIIRSAIEKQRRRLWFRSQGKESKDVKFSKPKLEFVYPELNANCIDFKFKEGKFNGFVRVKCTGFGDIKLPINKTKPFDKWSKGSLCNSLKIFKNSFQLSWKIETKPSAKGGRVVGVDQGMKTVATLSDGQTTPNLCPHGHSYVSINEKLCRKKKGSKAFKRAQAHRKNFVNWSINQLDFNFKEVRLEKIVNIRFKKRTSRKLSHWSNPEIRDKIKRRCEELEVPVVEQSCAYRSQRCHQCGLVRKSNRKGKIYSCSCGLVCDSDWNAAMNHEADIPDVPYSFLSLGLNKQGFYWNSSFTNLDGSELLVPIEQKNIFQ